MDLSRLAAAGADTLEEDQVSRTRKGSKGPGWEPWSNKHERAAERADVEGPRYQWTRIWVDGHGWMTRDEYFAWCDADQPHAPPAGVPSADGLGI